MLSYIAFLLILILIAQFHDQKKQINIVFVGFIIETILFIFFKGMHAWIHHFGEYSRYMLFINLALLLPGFGVLAHYFEESGVAKRIAKFVTSDGQLLWIVFGLSILLDNIAAALIGCVFLKARYGQPPFKLLVGCIGASNLGGAASFIGDTTTVMLYLSGVSPLVLSKAFAASIPAQWLLVKYVSKHEAQPIKLSRKEPTPLKVRNFAPLLGIPGLILGNQFHDQAGLGLIVGITLGLVLAKVRISKKLILDAVPSTVFLLLLVASAESVPLEPIKALMVGKNTNAVAIITGILSSFFDNIPLTALCIALKDFDWSLLAYCVGYGGSMMWFGSSTGIAVVKEFREVGNTKKWIKPFFVLLGIYFSGVLSYLLIWHGIIPTLEGFFQVVVGSMILLSVVSVAFAGILYIQFRLAKAGKRYFPGNKIFRSWLAELKADWH